MFSTEWRLGFSEPLMASPTGTPRLTGTGMLVLAVLIVAACAFVEVTVPLWLVAIGVIAAIAGATWVAGRRTDVNLEAATTSALVNRLRFGNVVMAIEGAVLLVVGVSVVIGVVRHAVDTGFKLQGLLTILDDRWKGVLVLAGLLFFRTVQEVLHRIETFKTPLGDLKTRTQVDRAGRRHEVDVPKEDE